MNIGSKFSGYTVPEIIKIVTPKDNLKEFLDFYLNNYTIYKFKELFDTLYTNDNSVNNFENKTRVSRYSKFYLPIMFLLYNESIYLNDDVIDLVSNYSTYNSVITACSKILGTFVDSNNIIEKKYYLRNYIKFIYHHRQDIVSYSNIDNIKSIFTNIYNTLTKNEQNVVKYIIATYIKLQSSETSNFNGDELKAYAETLQEETINDYFYKMFCRINESPALIENNQIFVTLSCLINNINLKTFNDIIIMQFVNEPLFGQLLSIFEDDIDACINSVFSLFSKISAGTINYNVKK